MEYREFVDFALSKSPTIRCLDPQDMMSSAENLTGLNDWGGDKWDGSRFIHDFKLLCNDIESEGRLSNQGRGRAYSRLLLMLCSRLLCIASFAKQNMAGKSAAKFPPLIGTGFPRAGTTFLFGILSSLPRNRSAQAWESAMPVPPCKPAEYLSDSRRELYQKLLTFQGFTDTRLTSIHPFDAELPEESIFMQEADCNALYTAYFNTPGFQQAIVDKAASAYKWQIQLMRMLEQGWDFDRWILKGPGDLFSWNEMLKAFPSSKIILNHRDPLKVIPSIASLYMGIRGLFSDVSAEAEIIGPQLLAAWSEVMNAHIDWREENPDDDRVIDVYFHDLISDPVQTVVRIYESLGDALNDTDLDCIKGFLSTDQHAKAPRRKYTLEEFGLRAADVENAFSRYYDYFPVQGEK